MRWSFRIFKAGETEVRIHLTLLLFMGWYGIEAWRGGGAAGAIDEVAYLGLLFLSVLLHEFGHIFAARHYAIPTPEILLTPIGGVARIARMPEKPFQELVVALAGPAVTLAIILTLAGGLALTGHPTALYPPTLDGPLVPSIMGLNMVLLAFNLIPAFPMDGGRVLRAALSSKLGLLRGTEIAARIGQAIAVGFVYLGLQYNPMLILIAVFVFLGAQSEFAMVRQRETGAQVTARSLMVSDVRPLLPDTTIAQAIDYLTSLDQRAFPIIDADGRLLGTATRDDLLLGVSRHGVHATVSTAMQPAVGDLVIPIGMAFEPTIQRLLASGREALPVVDEQGHFAGLITRDNMTDVLLVSQLQADAANRRPA